MEIACFASRVGPATPCGMKSALHLFQRGGNPAIATRTAPEGRRCRIGSAGAPDERRSEAMAYSLVPTTMNDFTIDGVRF